MSGVIDVRQVRREMRSSGSAGVEYSVMQKQDRSGITKGVGEGKEEPLIKQGDIEEVK